MPKGTRFPKIDYRDFLAFDVGQAWAHFPPALWPHVRRWGVQNSGRDIPEISDNLPPTFAGSCSDCWSLQVEPAVPLGENSSPPRGGMS
jgi:hypothetical protein